MKITRRQTGEISIAEIKEAISSGRGPEVIRPYDELEVTLENGETVTAVCAGYVAPTRARFALKDGLSEPWFMNKIATTNKGGYLKSEGRRHVLEDILPLFPAEFREAFAPRFFCEEIDGEKHEYADTLYLPRMTDLFGPGPWWNDEPDCVQLEIFKNERDRVKECGDKGTRPYWSSSVDGATSTYFCCANSNGTASYASAHISFAFAPFFDLSSEGSGKSLKGAIK